MHKPEQVKVTFQPVGTRTVVRAGATVLEAGREAGLILVANCGGNGLCGRCRVTILDGRAETPTRAEIEVLKKEELVAGQRLACRTTLYTDTSIHVPRITMGNQQRLQLDGRHAVFTVEACVQGHVIEVTKPAQKKTVSDFDRVTHSLEKAHGTVGSWCASPSVLRAVSRWMREPGQRFKLVTRANEVIGLVDGDKQLLGVAVDIGCTKIAAYLMDIETGKQLAACGIPNPQISFGEDLISRLVYARKGLHQAQELAHCVQAGINQLIRTLLQSLPESASAGPEQMADLCVVGNTAMVHLFLGMPTEGLLVAPFLAATTSSIDIRAVEAGIDLPNDVYVHVLPAIGAFVGADHVAMILANGLHQGNHVSLGVDIGTNTEIVLSRPDQGLLLTASCPAGPAFEGGHIQHGMRAAPGAIEKITLKEGCLAVQTVGGQPPLGLCGSGIIDAVALLWQMGAINFRGHLQSGTAGVRDGDSGKQFLLVEAENTGHGRDIVISQQDISEVQLAKAAVAASIKTLLKISKTDPDEIQELVLAGAFGSYLGVGSSINIGLLPDLPNATYQQVGNAAGIGAKMALVSAASREQAGRVARLATRVELKQQEGFNRELALATRFPVRQQEKDRHA